MLNNVNNFEELLKLSGDVILPFKIIANAKTNSFEFCTDYVKLRINKPAVDGKANKEIIAYLSDLTGLSKNKIKIISGEKSSLKRIQFIL